MNHHETRGTVTEVVEIKTSGQILSHLKKNADTSFTTGGLLSDFELAWMYNGPHLKVISTVNGSIQSSWDFSLITRDNKTEITSVIEYEASEHGNRLHYQETQLCLIVSYTSQRDSNKASYISFCHPRTSKILHTITTKEKITCLSLITSKKDHSCPISGIVKLMSGSLAIGTKSGNLLIMDIKGYDLLNEVFSCSRKSTLTDLLQNRSSCMLVLDVKHYSENEIKDKICKVDDENYHVAVSILVSDKKETEDHDLGICAMKYIPEGLTLAVGFRSGVFQLWDISSLKRLYKSSYLTEATPIVKFGFQEPCNDPQNFCYLWVIHEADREDDICLPFAVMYGILYKKVVTTSDYGRYYKNFVHCKKRFDMDVDMERSSNGRCIACNVVSNTPSNMLRHATHNELKSHRYGSISEEDPSKINLFAMVFETWEHHSDSNSHISLVVFDMNQWYKAQMPHQCYNGYSVPFVNFVLLDRVSERKSTLLDMRIKKDTIQQFLTFNLSEEYSYPSSLSFDTVFLTQTKVINLRIPGVQRCIIEQIVAEGPTCLVNPNKYYTDCKDAGLRPCFSDNYGHVIVPSQIQQRNYVLTILLEHKMSSFLVRCVKEWADGSRAVSGCTLPHLIQWAWDCVTRIKQLTDVICIPLFDYSGDDLDRENYQKLKHCGQLLHLIQDLLSHILKNFKHYLLDSKKLNYQVETLQLVTKYFDVIIWCLDVGMLPEKVTSSSDRCIPTYMIGLMQFAEQRREELKTVVMKDRYFLTEECSLYIIDAILEKENGGKALRLQWERESCGMTNGFYPPVTLQSLLRMFLMPNVSTDVKHFIMMYFLLDVCDYHRDEDMKEQLLSFSVIFFSDSKFLNFVRACWFVDHEKFEEASDLLMTDAVITLLKKNINIYETILKACVCQAQYELALKCERIIKLSLCFKNESFHITLLLLNGLIMEAYTTLRRNCLGQKQLLRNFFNVCDELGYLKEIFKFPLLPEEEEEFISYLDGSDNKDAGDLKIMYLLSRGRYIEAVDINHNMGTKMPKYGIIGNDTTKQENSGRTTTRDLLVNAFCKTLPSVTNDLINICRKEKDKIYRHQHITKPTPMSVIVHVDTEKQVPVYKSSFESVMQAAISKTVETWTKFPKFDKCNKNVSLTQHTPFLRTEIMTPKRKQCNTSFRNSFLKEKVPENKKDPDEPPTKRMRKTLDISLGNVTEVEDEELSSAPLEVTKILRTPHIQKRLNKLLENTPESSPLTSILKSSEISRFKQPQKVGFSVPVVHKRTPLKKSPNVSTSVGTSTIEDNIGTVIENSRAKKVLDFDRTNESSANDINLSTNTTKSEESQVIVSEDKEDSYYSLESSNESEKIMNFILDDAKTKESRKVIVECMSEEDGENTLIIENVLESNTSEIEFHIPLTPVKVTRPVEIESMEVEYSGYKTVENESAFINLETESPITDNSSQFGREIYEEEVKTYEDVKPEYSSQKLVEEQKPNEVDSNVDNASNCSQEYESDTEKKESSVAEELSDEEYESREQEDEYAQQEQEPEQERYSSVTEVSYSSDQEDSDIEIIEDTTTPMVVKAAEIGRSVDEEEQLSEKTYESEYSYSDEGLEEESEPEEQSVADEADENSVYVEDSNESIQYEENEVEYEEEEEVEDEEEPVYENSPQIDYDQLKNIVSTIAAAEAENEKNENQSIINESAPVNESVSICEVFDATQSILEETEHEKETSLDQSVEVIDQTAESEKSDVDYSIVNVSNITHSNHSKIEEKAENVTDNEPPLVFYFGENSVTSIGEDMLTEERDLSNTRKSVGENKSVSEKSDDEERQMEVDKQETSGEEAKEEIVESQIKYSPVKAHDFLRTSVPECNIHIIEKVRNEMYSSDDGYDDSDVQNDLTPEDVVEVQSVHPPQKARVIDVTYDVEKIDVGSTVEEPQVAVSYQEQDVEMEKVDEKEDNEIVSFKSSNDMTEIEIQEESADVTSSISEPDTSVDVSVVQMTQLSQSQMNFEENIEISYQEIGIAESTCDNLGFQGEPSEEVLVEDVKSSSPGLPVEDKEIVDVLAESSSSDVLVEDRKPSRITPKSLSPEKNEFLNISESPSSSNVLVEDRESSDIAPKLLSPEKNTFLGTTGPPSSSDLPPENIELVDIAVKSSPLEVLPENEKSDDTENKTSPSKATEPVDIVKSSPSKTPPNTEDVESIDVTIKPSLSIKSSEDIKPVEIISKSSPEVEAQTPIHITVPPLTPIVIEKAANTSAQMSPSTSRRRSIRIARRSIDCFSATEREKDDDNLSLKSGSSAADSVISKVSADSVFSVQSQTKRKYSTGQLMRVANKSAQLDVIVSDEEMPSQKPLVSRRSIKHQPKYAASEPDNGLLKRMKRKRDTKSENGNSDDEKLSTMSEVSGRKRVYQKNVRRKSDLYLMNEAMLKTPAKIKTLGKFISSTPLVLNKNYEKRAKQTTDEIEKYANSRRLTRAQKLCMEYSFINRDLAPIGLSPSRSNQPIAAKNLTAVEEDDSEYSLTIDPEQDAKEVESKSPSAPSPIADIKAVPLGRKTTPRKSQPCLPSRFSRRLSDRFEQRANDDSLSSEEPPSPAKSVSSVASTSSRASTTSRKSQIRRRSFTSMELRRSSVKPHFKPLAVIASDDESPSFDQTPIKTVDESILSSSESVRSEPRSKKFKKKATDSDMESVVSEVSVSGRKKVAKKTSKSKSQQESDVPEAASSYASNRRLTRNQRNKMEQTLKATSMKKK